MTPSHLKPVPPVPDILYCSFCGKSEHEVRKLAHGVAAAICNQCVPLVVILVDGLEHLEYSPGLVAEYGPYAVPA